MQDWDALIIDLVWLKSAFSVTRGSQFFNFQLGMPKFRLAMLEQSIAAAVCLNQLSQGYIAALHAFHQDLQLGKGILK